jgi:hypothetical protein
VLLSKLCCSAAQVEAIASDADKGDAGISTTEILNLALSSVPAASQAAASQAADGAGPSTAAAPPGAVVKLGGKEREAALDLLAEEGWLCADVQRGVYRLGPRAFLELGGYLLDVAAEEVRELWAARV